MSGEDDGVSGIASRFEQPAEDEPVQSKIADIASRFQGGSTPVGYAPKPKGNTYTYTNASDAGPAPKKSAPVKEGGVPAASEESEDKSVGSIAARFSSAAKKEKEEEAGESAFSAAKGAFMKAEASKPADTETKVMGVAAMFGDTTAAKPAHSPMPRATSSAKAQPPATVASRVSNDTGPGVANAAAMFQSGAAGKKSGGDDDGEEEEQPSERFANAAKMFGGN